MFEGDDGLVRLNSWLAELRPEIIASYNELGLDAKVAFTRWGTDDFTEFVGKHFLVSRGKMLRGAWCPDIMRSLTNISFAGSVDVHGNVVSAGDAYAARADSFRGRCDPMCRLMGKMALHHEREYDLPVFSERMTEERQKQLFTLTIGDCYDRFDSIVNDFNEHVENDLYDLLPSEIRERMDSRWVLKK